MEYIEQFIREDEGQDVVEYGLLIATIALLVLLSTTMFGSALASWFNTLSGRITKTGTA